MATIGVRYFEQIYPGQGFEGTILEFQEEASQTFLLKQPVVLDSTTGEVEVAADTGQIFGFSLKAATGTTGTLIPVLLADRIQLWSGNKSTAGASVVTALTDLGDLIDWLASTETGQTAKTVLDTGSQNMFEIVALDPRDAVGDTGGRLIFRVEDGKVGVKTT